jgi:hypothetical protein
MSKRKNAKLCGDKLFVSIDDHTSLGELANLLQIDVDLVLNAVSLYCRLSFAVKKQKQEDSLTEGIYDSTWKDYKKKIKKNLVVTKIILIFVKQTKRNGVFPLRKE